MVRSLTKFCSFFLTVVLFASSLFADTTAVQRDSFFFTKKTTSTTTEPSTLQYYDFKENLPDEIAIDVFKNRDLSNIAGKRVFVGYGVVDPTGDDCKVFTPDVTGQDNNITICLPWWRIERSYEVSQEQGSGAGFTSFLKDMQRPRPPKNVTICDEWQASQSLPGGTVTCTTYYDRTISQDCFDNPRQAQCKKNNCGSWILTNCTRTGSSLAYNREYLENVQIEQTAPTRFTSKVDLVTLQFICPGGSYTNYSNCTDEKTIEMSPYECKADDPSTPLDDSIMKYCDEESPVRDAVTGEITGFLGTCPAEASESNTSFQVTCQVNSFTQTRNTCTEYAPSTTNQTSEINKDAYDLKYTEQRVRVLSGAVDRFATRDDCVRANTVDGAREDSVYMLASGTGNLDDDIYLIVHSSDDTHNVVYCNQQHNNIAGSKLNFPELGGIVQCIPNTGTYSFSKKVNIRSSDVVSIQQATEDEDGLSGAPSHNPFSYRSHYSSSKVLIDNIEATPEAYPANFPFMPTAVLGQFLKNWENTLGSLAIMFPYSGSYTLYFYTEAGELVAEKDIGTSVFNTLGAEGFHQLFLAKDIPIAPTLNENNETTLCLNDDWAEYGGGVYGGRASISGETCQSPSSGNSYQTSKAIKRVVVKDRLTGIFTVIPLVYPLGYPNRVFISKLKLYEDRVYHCYDEPSIKPPF